MFSIYFLQEDLGYEGRDPNAFYGIFDGFKQPRQSVEFVNTLKHDNFRCIWQKTENPRAPRCIYPKEMGYTLDEETIKQNRYSIRQSRKQSPFGTDIHQLVSVTVDQYSPQILRIKVNSKNVGFPKNSKM